MPHPWRQPSPGLGHSSFKPGVSTYYSLCTTSLTSDLSWLYTLTLGMDANFRLKSRLRGSVARDPSLGSGFAYFVEYDAYIAFIRDYVDEEDVSLYTTSFHTHD